MVVKFCTACWKSKLKRLNERNRIDLLKFDQRLLHSRLIVHVHRVYSIELVSGTRVRRRRRSGDKFHIFVEFSAPAKEVMIFVRFYPHSAHHYASAVYPLIMPVCLLVCLSKVRVLPEQLNGSSWFLAHRGFFDGAKKFWYLLQ